MRPKCSTTSYSQCKKFLELPVLSRRFDSSFFLTRLSLGLHTNFNLRFDETAPGAKAFEPIVIRGRVTSLISEDNIMNKSTILKLAGLVLLTIGMASVGSAAVFATPEIDAATGASALALLSGAWLIIRSKKR
jgi:hypothetical protein